MSQKLDLDFAPNQAFSLSRFTPVNLLILLTGLLVAIYVALSYQTKNAEYNEARAQLEKVQPVKKPELINEGLQKIPTGELKQASDTLADLSTPWSQLLSALEQLDMHEVALLSLDPSKKKRQVVLSGQAKNMQAALYYVEALEKLPMLSQVYLQKHNIDQLDPFKPVTFTVIASWS